MLGFIKKIFIGLLSVCAIGTSSGSFTANMKGFMKFVSLNNQPCKARPEPVNINSNKTLFIHLLLVLKSGGSCNTIDDSLICSSLCSK